MFLRSFNVKREPKEVYLVDCCYSSGIFNPLLINKRGFGVWGAH